MALTRARRWSLRAAPNSARRIGENGYTTRVPGRRESEATARNGSPAERGRDAARDSRPKMGESDADHRRRLRPGIHRAVSQLVHAATDAGNPRTRPRSSSTTPPGLRLSMSRTPKCCGRQPGSTMNLTQILRLCLSGPFVRRRRGGLLRLLARAADVRISPPWRRHLADTQAKVRRSFVRILGKSGRTARVAVPRAACGCRDANQWLWRSQACLAWRVGDRRSGHVRDRSGRGGGRDTVDDVGRGGSRLGRLHRHRDQKACSATTALSATLVAGLTSPVGSERRSTCCGHFCQYS